MRRLFVVNSRHIVLARIKTPKESYQTPENAFSDTLLMSGFRIFAADALCDFFFAPNQGKCPIISKFLPESLVGTCCHTAWHNRHMYGHDIYLLAALGDRFELLKYLADIAMMCKGVTCSLER